MSPREVPDGINYGYGISRTLAALEVLAEGSIAALNLVDDAPTTVRLSRRPALLA